MEAFLYAILFSNGQVKIGISGRPFTRLGELQFSIMRPISMIAYQIPRKARFDIEKKIHLVFQSKRIGSEYFEFDYSDWNSLFSIFQDTKNNDVIRFYKNNVFLPSVDCNSYNVHLYFKHFPDDKLDLNNALCHQIVDYSLSELNGIMAIRDIYRKFSNQITWSGLIELLNIMDNQIFMYREAHYKVLPGGSHHSRKLERIIEASV